MGLLLSPNKSTWTQPTNAYACKWLYVCSHRAKLMKSLMEISTIQISHRWRNYICNTLNHLAYFKVKLKIVSIHQGLIGLWKWAMILLVIVFLLYKSKCVCVYIRGVTIYVSRTERFTGIFQMELIIPIPLYLYSRLECTWQREQSNFLIIFTWDVPVTQHVIFI